MLSTLNRKPLAALLLVLIYAAVHPGNLAAQTPKDDEAERDTFEVSAYTGFGIDTFAADDHARYLNYADTQSVKERGVGGITFGYRAAHSDRNPRFPMELWVFGETLYGMRSTEVDCTQDKNKELGICKGLVANPGQRTLYLMRNASSVEGFAGFRFEFLALNPDSKKFAANVYLKTQLGFMTVSKGGNDAIDDHTWGAVGGIITRGSFRNSYAEVGRGRTQLFKDAPGDRWKFDGYLEVPFFDNLLDGMIRPFAQMYVNVDNGPHSDSVQTFFGVNFDVKRLFGEWNPKKN